MKSTCKTDAAITVNKLQITEIAILKYVQQTSFAKEIELLENGKTVNKISAPYKLCPPLDSVGMLRVGGRLARASFTEDRKHQIIIPSKCHMASLIIREHHAMSGHSGRELVLSSI